MTENINSESGDEDTEGHVAYRGGEPSAFRDAEPSLHGGANPTDPKTHHDDEDDTAGHAFREPQPAISGALSVDPDALG